MMARDRRESRNLAGRELEIAPLRFAPVGMTTRLGEGEELLGLRVVRPRTMDSLGITITNELVISSGLP